MKNLGLLLTFVLLAATLGLAQSQINQFQVLRLGQQSTAPANPPANSSYLYVNSSGTVVCLKPDGTSCLSTSSGTVTSIATTSPITGGTITGTGTIACATCGVTDSPLSQFAATTSAQLAGVISNETGSGLLVFATTPTLTTPVLGVATATSINKVALTAPTTSATLTIADGKTLTASNSLTFAGTDSTVMTFPSTSATIPQTVATGTKALATSAISSAACSSAQTSTATGTLTTDIITASFNGDPTAVTGYVPLTTGMLTIIVYPTADTVNFKVCNNTSASITPGAITLNWKVVR